MKGFCLEVNGSYACFTRPEMKVERVSYDVITPSAARAIYDAILWKPAIFWRVNRIEVLSPIRWISVRRNEVGAVASTRKSHIFIEDDRQQRAGLFLRDVKYRLFAEFEFIPSEKRCKVYNPIPEYLHDTEELEIVRQDKNRPNMPPCLNAAPAKASASISLILAVVNFRPTSGWLIQPSNQQYPFLKLVILVGCFTTLIIQIPLIQNPYFSGRKLQMA